MSPLSRKENCSCGVVGENAGQEIGLEFQPDRQPVVLLLGHLSPLAVNVIGETEQVLHMVTDFVGHHVGLGEVARGAEALASIR